jgi:hypothetical protein
MRRIQVALAHCGIVDQDVNAAEVLHSRAKRVGNVVRARDIAGERQNVWRYGGWPRAVQSDDVGATAGEGSRIRLAHTPGGAGNHDDAIVEVRL